jgi:hypothetical protein
MPQVFMVSVSESAWPTRRTSDRIVVAMGRRLSIPPKDLIADAKQLEGPVPNMIDMEDEYELAPPNSSGDHREASEMDVLATLAPLDLPVRLHFLFERKEILYIGFRERHATIFNMLVRRPSAASGKWDLARYHNHRGRLSWTSVNARHIYAISV